MLRVQLSVSIADGTFSYTPPARIPVATFNGGSGADV
jgi:hypothetical protein